MELADIYRVAAELYGLEEYELAANKTGVCGTWLQFNESTSRPGVQSLRAANFCQLRLCPMCIARRARRAAVRLSQVMDAVQQEQDAKFLFLTLTIRNVDGEDLGDAIGRLTAGWHKLVRHRDVARALGGWFRAIEITRNAETQEYHPHIHAILAVPHSYGPKSDTYISQEAWRRHWMVAAGLDYDPSVRISRTKAKGRGDDAASRQAAVEAAKYVTKSADYIDQDLGVEEAALIVHQYTRALFRRRLTAFGGWLKDAAARFDCTDLEGGDLVHTELDAIRDDVADIIATYSWNLGAGDYILVSREVNPALLQRGGISARNAGDDEPLLPNAAGATPGTPPGPPLALGCLGGPRGRDGRHPGKPSCKAPHETAEQTTIFQFQDCKQPPLL